MYFSYFSFDYSLLTLPPELNELFSAIESFEPQELVLPCVLRPFIPEYIPSIAGIDPFLKPDRPDIKKEPLGTVYLDERLNKTDVAGSDQYTMS